MATPLAFTSVGPGAGKAPGRASRTQRSRRFPNPLWLLRHIVAPRNRRSIRLDIDAAIVAVVVIGLMLVAGYRLAGAIESLQVLHAAEPHVAAFYLQVN